MCIRDRREARRPRRAAPKPRRRRLSADSKPWTRTSRPVGPAGTAASSIWDAGPFSISASVLFGQ
eukprot:5718150-Alexandrium_andersonii.AAC.1